MEIYEKIDFTDSDFKTLLREKLHENEVSVTFTKRDGSERAMQCTLSAARIPAEQLPKESGTGTVKTFSEEAIRVFDTQKSEWRSFRWDSVTKVEFTL